MEVSFALKTALELAQNGNKSSFEFVYKETFSFAWRRASVIMKNNPDTTADIVQEAYIICYQQISNLKNIDAFYSWLSSIIYHLGMQHYRKQKLEFLLTDSEFDWDEIPLSIDINNSPELSAEEQATKDILKELIENLPELQIITLIAHYFDGLKIEQIANIMQCPESTVKSRLNYARVSLKNAIERMEIKHGYRIHAFSNPLLYYALKELLQDTPIIQSFQSSLFQEIQNNMMSDSLPIKSNVKTNEDALNQFLSSTRYTANISAALDSAKYVTTSLGISAVLTATLTDASAINIEPMDTLGLLKIDFSSLITSIKTKFALASAATAIGNNELVLMQEVDVPHAETQAIEAVLSGYLYDYKDYFNSENILFNITTDEENISVN